MCEYEGRRRVGVCGGGLGGGMYAYKERGKIGVWVQYEGRRKAVCKGYD